MRWVGIDEAGGGADLGPLGVTGGGGGGGEEREPDVWGDLSATVARAGDASGRLWVDDSKAILRLPSGRLRLESTCRSLLVAAGAGGPGGGADVPLDTLADLLAAVGAGTLEDAELTHWLEPGEAPPLPGPSPDGRAFEGAAWRITAVHSVVVGPSRFNSGLDAGGSKAKVHFSAFAHLLGALWERAGDGLLTRVRGDKHGGRHFYYDPLLGAFPDVWIDRGPEGPALSRYTLRGPGRRLELSLLPRADASDGLVALASIVSKAVRERWMDRFNAHWAARIPGLRPTAGYPLDARRFRESIEPDCRARGLDPRPWRGGQSAPRRAGWALCDQRVWRCGTSFARRKREAFPISHSHRRGTSPMSDPKREDVQSTDSNRDPITGEPGAHPVGAGVGAAVGGAATGAAAGAVAGPVGAVVGAVAGGVVGGLAGKG